MDWMYKGISGVADREEYLTGRKIDKTFEMMEKEENPNAAKDDEESALINQLAQNNFADNFSKNDMTAKMREDPLFAIQMKQQEQRKEILHNPVKLKHLQELLKTSLKKDKKHKKKDKKKSKKKHKTKKSRRSSSSERHRKSSPSDSSSEESDTDAPKTKRRLSPERRDNYDLSQRHRGDSAERKRTYSESSSSNHHHRHHSQSSHSHSSRRPTYERTQRTQPRPKMSEEEIRKRREEMMSNAEWREKERSDTVKKLTEREKEEDKRQQSTSSSGAKFIKPMLAGLANNSSIENSIRQKKFTSQRGSGLMDTNFARRH